MRYDKAKLPEFYLQEENLEKIIAEMVKHTGNSQIMYHRYSQRSVILAPAQAAIKHPQVIA